MKMQVTGEAQAKAHYADLASRPFFGALVDYICSGPVVAMVWEGKASLPAGVPQISELAPPTPLPRAPRSPVDVRGPGACRAEQRLPGAGLQGVVKTGRVIIGATNPADSAPGSIRGDFCIEVGRNIIHGSDAVESANKEIALWFPEGICEWSRTVDCQIYEKL